jgi:toxin FitB
VAFLLDTNLLSEQTKPKPNAGVLAWLEAHSVLESFISVVTLGEIKQGIVLLGNTKRARGYGEWLSGVEREFDGRILSVDRAVMHTWASITAEALSAGKTLGYADSLIAATALTHNLSIVTRNTEDFSFVTDDLINPWS